MSGPKGIQYEIDQERRRLEDARAEWRGLCGRHEHARRRAGTHGVTLVAIDIPRDPGRDSASVRASCAALARKIATAEGAIDAAAEQLSHGTSGLKLDDAIARIAAEERAARAQRAPRAEVQTSAPASREAPSHFDSAAHHDQISARLQALGDDVSGDLVEFAGTAARASTPSEARMLLKELDSRIAHERAKHSNLTQQRATIGGLRTRIESLFEPARLSSDLDRLQQCSDRGEDVSADLAALSNRADATYRSEQPERDRLAVLDSVKSSLERLGYATTDIEVATSQGLVLQSSRVSTHGVQVTVNDEEVDIRNVVTTEAQTTSSDNRAADVALCEDLPQLQADLERVGIKVQRIRKTPPGLVAPARVAAVSAAVSARIGATTKRAGTQSRRLKQHEGGTGQ